MRNKGFSKTPPFVWPDPGDGINPGASRHLPYDKLLRIASKAFGVVYALDASGVMLLHELCRDRSELLCRLIIVVSPACATSQTDLQALIALQRQYGDRIQFRIQALSVSESLPTSAMCLITDSDPDGLLLVGSSSNFGSDWGAPGQANLVFRCDAGLRTAFGKWLDGVWLVSSPLTAEIAAIPPLVPAAGSIEADEMWRQYEAACRSGLEALASEIDKSVEDSSQEKGIDSKKSATAQLGVPLLDELGERITKVIATGFQVTIDKHTRIPPLDAPIKPEWFGVESLRQVGAVTRRVEYRISALSDQTSRSLNNKKKGTRTLLDLLSFPLNEGVRWMPDRVFPMFEEEMNRGQQ